MANNRIFYAMQQVAVDPQNRKTRPASLNEYQPVPGVQSVSMTTSFSLEQAFELGQVEIYENIEGVPSIEMTINRLLDGSVPLYVLGAGSFENADVVTTAATNEVGITLGIFDEANASVGTNTPISQVTVVDAVMTNVAYTMGVDGNFTEEVGFSSNEKAWYLGDPATCTNALWASGFVLGSGRFDGADSPDAVMGVQRREYFDRAGSTLPDEIPDSGFKIQSINVSADFGREDLFQLGDKGPYAKAATFPIEVSCSFEVLSTGGDQINAVSSGCTSVANCASLNQLTDQTIILKTCDGTVVDLGGKNKLSSVSYGGGDAGGGNVTTTFDYVTYNKLSISGSGSILV
ncbi:MAG: hypothetical protein ACXADH_17470 [Candidatus Kariarchaeaceae archaeon]|jgi:hypothetical protein